MTLTQIDPNTCTLRLAADGQAEVCSRERCPFWLPGRAVLERGCIVERLGVDVRSPAVARYLLGGRERLEQVHDLAERGRDGAGVPVVSA